MRSVGWKMVSFIFAAFFLFPSLPVWAAPAVTRNDILKLLDSPFQKKLFDNTYHSLLHRLAPDGYLPESLTGSYGGMFPRTVGPYVFLMLEKGQFAAARKVLQYTLLATAQSHLHRVPHVIGPAHTEIKLKIDRANPGQSLHSIVLYNLQLPNFGGAQPFTASDSKLYGAVLWLSASAHAKGVLRVEIVRSPTDQHPLALATLAANRLQAAGGWVRIEFKKPVSLQKGGVYALRVRFDGKGRVMWWGLNDAGENSYGGSYSYDKPPLGWRLHPGYLTAFALNYGTLKEVKRLVIPVFSNTDQPDGQYSVILAWARYIATTHDTAFENATYNQVARLADQATRTPYLDNGWPTTTTDLVRNPCFEDSRQGRFWDTYDLLTQVFVAEAWTEMIPIAKARGDMADAYKWQTALNELEHGIRYYLTRRLDGKLIYAERRLPNGYDGKIYTGLSWVNLSPIAAGWKGVNPKILNATVAAYWKRAAFQWDGFHLLGGEWNPPSTIAHVLVKKKYGWLWICKRISRPARINENFAGKQWAWEFLYSIQQSQWARAGNLLEFLQKANKTPLFSQTFIGLSDPGNGEQAAWYCWAITTAHKLLTAHTYN